MQEYLDILDKDGNKTGESQTYEDAHRSGLPHRSVHVWFLNSNKQLLLQKRSKNKQAYPGYWDISVGGHVSLGETSLDAAQKETLEEIGLNLPFTTFKFLFTLEEHIVLNDGTYVNNEFQDVYLIQSNTLIPDLKLSTEEVDEARWIDLDTFENWIKGKGEMLVPHEEEYIKLLELLKK